jgi:hypothetical protein
MQRLLLSRSKLCSSASGLAPALLSSPSNSVRLQHAAEAVSHNTAQHNRQPDLSNSNSRLEVDSWGAVSSIPGQDPVPHLRTLTAQGVAEQYINHDGRRVDDGRYKAFLRDASEWNSRVAHGTSGT